MFLSLRRLTPVITMPSFVVVCVRRGGKILVPNTALQVASDQELRKVLGPMIPTLTCLVGGSEAETEATEVRQSEADDVSGVKLFDVGSNTRSKDILVDSLDLYPFQWV